MPEEVNLGKGNTLNFLDSPRGRVGHYLEVQIWGQIKPSDIEAIILTSLNPEILNQVLPQLELILSLGIKVYNGNGTKLQELTP
jgi:hypothetical protein